VYGPPVTNDDACASCHPARPQNAALLFHDELMLQAIRDAS